MFVETSTAKVIQCSCHLRLSVHLFQNSTASCYNKLLVTMDIRVLFDLYSVKQILNVQCLRDEHYISSYNSRRNHQNKVIIYQSIALSCLYVLNKSQNAVEWPFSKTQSHICYICFTHYPEFQRYCVVPKVVLDPSYMDPNILIMAPV